MRLFHVSVLLLTAPLWGCKRETNSTEGVVRVFISYATFKPKCLTLIVEDTQNASNKRDTAVTVDPERLSDTRTGLILEQKGWSPNLRVTARAHERTCEGPVIALQSVEVLFPEKDNRDINLDLRAEDLDLDGYFANKGPHPGTDCDDTRDDVNPGAQETCDGTDNNCAMGESDVAGNTEYWVDADGDSYGDSSSPSARACGAPPGAALRGGDCNDRDAAIHPGQKELLCDGKDDNCNNVADDDPFDVGGTCQTEQLCVGRKACQGSTGSACVSSDVPVPYFVDDDGDGTAGHPVGDACAPPVAGATREETDCDEGTILASRMVNTESCDRLDNNCDRQVDEGLAGCAAVAWSPAPSPGLGSNRFDAITTYGKGRGWIAGDNNVVRIDNTTLFPVTNCDSGADWKSAWAASNGRVFLGSSNGQFGTVAPGSEGTGCTQQASGFIGGIYGLIGFEQPNQDIILYAATAQGRILRWRYIPGAANQETPTSVTQVSANLRAIHGVSPETMIAVGAETVSGQQRPIAFRAPASGSTAWVREELGVPDATGFLYGVRVLTPRLTYVAGEDGLLLEKVRDTWVRKPALTLPGGSQPTLRSMTAFGRTAIYAVTSEVNDIHFFNGTTWSSLTTAPQTLNALGGSGPGDVWAAGHSGTLLRWTPP
ncbi:putative lipoprotein [Myxococcus stipitatus DSM 14675]|uniref:Putative lipoprotein n=1 Tax=Myxococcus stipitatus (strain DSM 14675 / JCM 12634 / Mx s8) TaxID=1278073 RepID=L7UBK9_MYXSD|nr:putative metal-binding motif-containing protein [Myxococcus stipitatus]AGC45290.1 putative lipoprotein [Myxococcus stipitatus DSM 14675]